MIVQDFEVDQKDSWVFSGSKGICLGFLILLGLGVFWAKLSIEIQNWVLWRFCCSVALWILISFANLSSNEQIYFSIPDGLCFCNLEDSLQMTIVFLSLKYLEWERNCLSNNNKLLKLSYKIWPKIKVCKFLKSSKCKIVY